MDLDLQQQIQQRLAELPEDVQAAIRSSDQGAKLQAIGKRHNLHIDQVGKLEDETFLVMLGFADPGEFSEHLEGELSIAPQEAVAIATDVANEIFMPIRASMQAWAEDRAAHESAGIIADTLEKKAPIDLKVPPPPAPAASATPAPAPKPDLKPADTTFAQKTVQTVPPAPAKPQNYKADPYREPVE